MAFENITKRITTVKKDGIYLDEKLIITAWNPYVVDETLNEGESWLNMRRRTDIDREKLGIEKEENAQFISYCFNLQQKLDISCYEEVVEKLNKVNELLLQHPIFPRSIIHEEIQQVLTKAKK